MFLDLADLERGRFERRFEVGPEHELLRGFEAEIREPLLLDVELTNPSSRTYVLTARLRGTVHSPCRRCLTSVATELDHRFRIVYQEMSRSDVEEEDTGDEDMVRLEPGARGIDLRDEFRGRLFLETERFPLCREECRGLCPVCGKNLNEGECECVVETVDSRWKALEGIDLGSEEST